MSGGLRPQQPLSPDLHCADRGMKMAEDEKEKRAEAYRKEMDAAIEIVSAFIQPHIANNEEGRRAFQAFCIVKAAARAERTLDNHLSHRLQELTARLAAIETKIARPMIMENGGPMTTIDVKLPRTARKSARGR